MKQAEAGKGSRQRPGTGYADGREKIWGYKRCECRRCIREKSLTDNGLPLDCVRMIVCPICGNKRCPRASDHMLTCTNSNEPGQAGSVY